MSPRRPGVPRFRRRSWNTCGQVPARSLHTPQPRDLRAQCAKIHGLVHGPRPPTERVRVHCDGNNVDTDPGGQWTVRTAPGTRQRPKLGDLAVVNRRERTAPPAPNSGAYLHHDGPRMAWIRVIASDDVQFPASRRVRPSSSSSRRAVYSPDEPKTRRSGLVEHSIMDHLRTHSAPTKDTRTTRKPPPVDRGRFALWPVDNRARRCHREFRGCRAPAWTVPRRSHPCR